MSATPARTFDVRHLQIARAIFAAIAAIMITFSPDHSAAVGLSVFSGFAIATGLVFLLAAWLVYPAGARWPSGTMGALSIVAGMIAGIVGIRSTTLFFSVVISWALVMGLVETVSCVRERSAAFARGDAVARNAARDGLTVGIITIVVGVALLFVPAQYALQYYIDDANQYFTLTGITIGVGIFGGYAAIIAVYLAIAGLSPRTRPDEASEASQDRVAAQPADEAPGGTA
ncbi:acyl-CoA synthetase [Microbacterium sp. P01]|uniref:acyl-CoA synthetase n=1 Tax=unclassified Microbacterium TaxID=2609290 RepID=UPI00366EEA02